MIAVLASAAAAIVIFVSGYIAGHAAACRGAWVMSRKLIRKTWNGDSREAAMAAARDRMELAARLLRASHAEYLTNCGLMFMDRPFRSRAAPGWIYLPIEDCVILDETARKLAHVWANNDAAPAPEPSADG